MGEKPTAADEAMEQGRVRESPTRPSQVRPQGNAVVEGPDNDPGGIAVDEPGVIDNFAGQPGEEARNLNSSKSNVYRSSEEPGSPSLSPGTNLNSTKSNSFRESEPPQGDEPSGLAVRDPGATGSKDPKKS